MSDLFLPAGTEIPPSRVVPEGPITIGGYTLEPFPGNKTSRAWRNRHISVVASIDRGPHGALLHASIARRDRDPSWDEIKDLRRAIFADYVDVAMILPVEEDYVNLHQHCFHLWEIPVRWGIQ